MKITVLIQALDDEKMIRDVLDLTLEQMGLKQPQYEIFADPAILLQRLNKEVGLLLLDIQLNHVISGIDIVKVVRKEFGKNYPEIIMFTSLQESKPFRELIPYNIYAIVDKGLEFDSLPNIIRGALEKAQTTYDARKLI